MTPDTYGDFLALYVPSREHYLIWRTGDPTDKRVLIDAYDADLPILRPALFELWNRRSTWEQNRVYFRKHMAVELPVKTDADLRSEIIADHLVIWWNFISRRAPRV